VTPFDLVAPIFERHRQLPAEVPEAIRCAILALIPGRAVPRILDIGAGTGRIGRAFVNAGDKYVGLDLSFAMLREFGLRNAALLQADAEHLPFLNQTFDAVLLLHVISGAPEWVRIVGEARRVLAEGAPLILGHREVPIAGLDAQLKERLHAILQRMGLPAGESMLNRERALEFLKSTSRTADHVTVASWTASRTPRQFLERHRTGARFSMRPAAVQQSVLDELRAWAETRFGSLDRTFREEHTFQLQSFTFQEQSDS
jgi:SAM-dependent methyltransferase